MRSRPEFIVSNFRWSGSRGSAKAGISKEFGEGVKPVIDDLFASGILYGTHDGEFGSIPEAGKTQRKIFKWITE